MRLVIPWVFVGVIEAVAWPFGYAVYVTAQGGPGWFHRGKFGADSIHFVRRRVDERRIKIR